MFHNFLLTVIPHLLGTPLIREWGHQAQLIIEAFLYCGINTVLTNYKKNINFCNLPKEPIVPYIQEYLSQPNYKLKHNHNFRLLTIIFVCHANHGYTFLRLGVNVIRSIVWSHRMFLCSIFRMIRDWKSSVPLALSLFSIIVSLCALAGAVVKVSQLTQELEAMKKNYTAAATGSTHTQSDYELMFKMDSTSSAYPDILG